jgi:serine/threonine protein kinase
MTGYLDWILNDGLLIQRQGCALHEGPGYLKELKTEGSVYEIDYKVGEGLNAEVYRAFRIDSRGFSRQMVALKILKSRNAVSYLRREFETLAKVNSPYCVKVLAWENLASGCALALEWIDGVTLFELAEHSDFSSDLIPEIVAQIQAGLRDLQCSGLFHGDLHPGNVLIDQNGSVRMVDFASLPPDQGILQGAPAYLAPELWMGQPASMASDLFALGLIDNDLRHGFDQLPRTFDRARERAESIASDAPSLLARDPLSRVSFEGSFSKTIGEKAGELSLRIKLGAIVQSILEAKTRRLASTAVLIATEGDLPASGLQMFNRFKFARVARSAAAVVVALASVTAIPVRAEAPMAESPVARATVSIHSLRWLKIAINGREAGYSPLLIEKLAPGPHRISWMSPHGCGSRRISLHAGEFLRLSDVDFGDHH